MSQEVDERLNSERKMTWYRVMYFMRSFSADHVMIGLRGCPCFSQFSVKFGKEPGLAEGNT